MAEKSGAGPSDLNSTDAVPPADAPAQPVAPVASDDKEPPFAELFTMPETATDGDLQGVINRQIAWMAKKWKPEGGHTLLFLYDAAPINRGDADRIYQGLAEADREKPLLLILHSPGGDVAAAYFIGKLCRENTEVGFEVAVPRQAKSAATLLCCAADRIHMGGLSELGPIDPQIRDMPVLAVKHSLEHLSELATQYPGAREMLSDYLAKSLPIEVLGYYERAARSAVQYAERLLQSRKDAPGTTEENSELARRLVYDYKDHGFAIDAGESAVLFGGGVVVRNSPEYDFANRIYRSLNLIEIVIRNEFQRDFAFSGGIKGAWVRRRPS